MLCMMMLLLGLEQFSKQALEDQVRQWILDQAPAEGELYVGRIYIPNIRNVPQGEIRYDIQPRTRNQELIGRNSLRVDLWIDGRVYKTLMVQAETRLETLVGVVTSEIDRGEPLTEDDIEWQLQRVDRMFSPLIKPEDLEAGLQAKTLLRAGSILDRRKVETVPLVERGRMVTVIARYSGLTVRLRAKALGSGAAGDEIRLKNVDSGQLLLGRIEKNGEISLVQ